MTEMAWKQVGGHDKERIVDMTRTQDGRDGLDTGW